MRRSPIAALAAVAYAVILADLLTKVIAVALIGGETVSLMEGVRLGIVYNDGGAFGLPAREFGIELSTVITFGLILLMLRVCRELSAVDARAPIMLGLITGAGAANHIDMLASPRGVADFIALELGALEGIVFNIADVALLVGLVLCARTAGLIILRLVEQRSPAFALAGGAGPSAVRSRAGAARTEAAEVLREMPIFREPEAALLLRSATDGSSSISSGASSRREPPMRNGSRSTSRAAAPREGGRIASLFALPSRFDRAATPALVIACTFILVYSLAIVWLPDAGRSAPSALLLALGVFGTVFVAVYAEMALAERREMRAAERANLEVALGEPGWRPLVADSGVAFESGTTADGPERMIFDGSVPGAGDGTTSSGESAPPSSGAEQDQRRAP